MYDFSPFEKIKGRPEGNCKCILSEIYFNVKFSESKKLEDEIKQSLSGLNFE